MKLFLAVASLLSVLSLTACVSSTKQVDALARTHLDIPEKAEIAGVPFIEQKAGHCGPATLAMALEWAGKPGRLSEVTSQVYTPKSEGSFQIDMITAARRQGMMAIPVSGFRNLLNEVKSGHPVIVFENLALSWFPQWHYAIVFGYDLNNQTVLMHSGPEAFKRWDMKKFERSWKLADYWGLVILPPGNLSATATELFHSQAAAALEQIGHLEEADKAYESILKQWPKSLAALIGRANIAYSKQNSKQSEGFLNLAVEYHPNSPEAWNNLSVVQRHVGKTSLANSSQKKAESLARKTPAL